MYYYFSWFNLPVIQGIPFLIFYLFIFLIQGIPWCFVRDTFFFVTKLISIHLHLLVINVECCTLHDADASFSESLYGLRRRSIKLVLDKSGSNVDSNDNLHRSSLGRRQKVLSVVFLVFYLPPHPPPSKPTRTQYQARWKNGAMITWPMEYVGSHEINYPFLFDKVNATESITPKFYWSCNIITDNYFHVM